MAVELLPPDEDGVCRVHLLRGAVLPLLRKAKGRPQYAEMHVSYSAGTVELRMSSAHNFPINAPVRWDEGLNGYTFATKRWLELQWGLCIDPGSTKVHLLGLTPIIAGRYKVTKVLDYDEPKKWEVKRVQRR